jgi:hypothetical protein
VPVGAGHRFDLLLFTGLAEVDAGDLRLRVSAAVEERVGRTWSPDRIQILPLLPRSKDGAVDHAWCRDQYLTGALTRKARSAAQRAVTRVREALRPRDAASGGGQG